MSLEIDDQSFVGRKFVLWGRHVVNDTAALAKVGDAVGYVVVEEFVVEVVEQRNDVPGMFGDGVYTGFRARAEDGRMFTRNWDVYPDGAVIGGDLNWESEVEQPSDADEVRYVDAVKASSIEIRAIGGHTFREDGSFAVPTGCKVCNLHGDTYMVGEECNSCRIDRRRPGQTISYVGCPHCTAERSARERDKALRELHVAWDHPEVYHRLKLAGLDPTDWSIKKAS